MIPCGYLDTFCDLKLEVNEHFTQLNEDASPYLLYVMRVNDPILVADDLLNLECQGYDLLVLAFDHSFSIIQVLLQSTHLLMLAI